MKYCSICKIEKDENYFEPNRMQCRDCRKQLKNQWNKNYFTNNKKAIKQKQKEYREESIEEIKIKNQDYYVENKDTILENSKQYYQNNKESAIEYQKQYYANNKKDILTYQTEYRTENTDKIAQYKIDNKEEITEYNRKYSKNRKINDPAFKMRHVVSGSILEGLKRNKSSKNNISCFKYLPYSIQELKKYLEKQFESWMTWNNHGNYDPTIWDDNDPSTWTWQIDHIIPHSTFNYTSMEDQDFKDCWALSNLRPLSAKQNLLDGVNRIRHNK